ncbi:PRTRC system protein B [Deinococcus petrolearius]|uniref:PRTRC system protein B n=1 Tax=Deinococcus petrolearius TaxID=1751295 RepID=A0ABW1DKG1_9DEIO
MDVHIADFNSVIARYALVVYTDPLGQSGCIMQHALSIHDGQPALAEGIPVTGAVIKNLMQLNAVKSLQFLPTHLVALGVNSMAWVEERTTRPLLFGGALDKAVAALDGRPLPQPRLLFVVKQGRFSVYALRGQERPTAETKLAFAPYYNIFSSHEICTGSMRKPAQMQPGDIPAWMESFFYSNFVKPADSNKRWAFSGTYRELWDAASAAGEFKDEWLVDTNLTLGQVIGGN